jgi:hypothetical protein
MINHEKIIELIKIWHNLISCNHCKDRDFHFRINTHYYYDGLCEYEVEHHGYILHDKEAEFNTVYEAEVYLINDVLKTGIIQEIDWYIEHYGDPEWDQHGRYNKQDLESLRKAVLDIAPE